MKRYEVVVKDVDGKEVNRTGFLLRFNAKRRAASDNAHARMIAGRAALLVALTNRAAAEKLPGQMYYSEVVKV